MPRKHTGTTARNAINDQIAYVDIPDLVETYSTPLPVAPCPTIRDCRRCDTRFQGTAPYCPACLSHIQERGLPQNAPHSREKGPILRREGEGVSQEGGEVENASKTPSRRESQEAVAKRKATMAERGARPGRKRKYTAEQKRKVACAATREWRERRRLGLPKRTAWRGGPRATYLRARIAGRLAALERLEAELDRLRAELAELEREA